MRAFEGAGMSSPCLLLFLTMTSPNQNTFSSSSIIRAEEVQVVWGKKRGWDSDRMPWNTQKKDNKPNSLHWLACHILSLVQRVRIHHSSLLKRPWPAPKRCHSRSRWLGRGRGGTPFQVGPFHIQIGICSSSVSSVTQTPILALNARQRPRINTVLWKSDTAFLWNRTCY